MSKVIHVGWDRKTPDVGVHESMDCETCGTKMAVERNQPRYPRYYGGSKVNVETLDRCDVFTCPHAGEKWHNQVIALKMSQQKTPSFSLAAIYQSDIEKIIASKTPTKEIFDWN